MTSTSVFAAAFGALERAIEAAETGGEEALEALEAVSAAAAEAATDADDRVVRAKMERTCEVIMALSLIHI